MEGESEKDFMIVFFLAVCFGWLGLDRFYLGKHLIGIVKLLTFGGFGVLWLVDIVLLVIGETKDSEGKTVKFL